MAFGTIILLKKHCNKKKQLNNYDDVCKMKNSLLFYLILSSFVVFCQTSSLAASPPTVLGREQGDPIELALPVRNALPRRISIDALTQAEVDRFRQEIYNPSYAQTPRGPGYIPECMQWLFKRKSKSHIIQPVVFALDGNPSTIKINGILRPIFLSSSHLSELKLKQDISLRIISFRAISGPVDLLENRELPLKDYDEWASDQSRSLAMLDVTFKGVSVETRKTPCTYLKADCRRYVAPIQAMDWIFHPRLPTDDFNSIGERVAISVPNEIELLIEDMCPYHRVALAEKGHNTRLIGERPGIKKYGFPKNPELMDALKPYVKP